MSILTKLLERRGIKDPTELSADEKTQFDVWHATLTKEDISVEDIEIFCTAQLANIDAQFKDLDRSDKKSERLIIMHSVYSAIKSMITAPRAEREALEKYLTQLLK